MSNNKTMLMIHGMMGRGDGTYWTNYKTWFEQQGYQCLTPSLRFHQKDLNDDQKTELGSLSLLDYVNDLVAIMDNLSEQPIILGHSMGGLLAQMLADRGYGSHLVLVSSAPPRGIHALQPSVIRSFFKTMMRAKFWKTPFVFDINDYQYAVGNLLTQEQQNQCFNDMVLESGRVVFEIGLWALDRTKASQVHYHRIKQPTLFLAGSEDRIVPASLNRQNAKKIPHATYVEYPNHAHWMLGEQGWENIAQDIHEWLLKNS